MSIALPADVWLQLAPDEAPAHMPHWLPAPHPPSATSTELEAATNPPDQAPGILWEWRRREGAWQGRVAYRRPMRDVGWISHRDWVDARRLTPR